MNDAARTVLVIDDDEDIRAVVAMVLDAEGYAAEGAPDGVAALERLRRAPRTPGLILLDLRMPRMSGAEFVAALRADPRLRAIPVVVVSGDASACETAAKIGATACLPKPMDLDALVETVQRLIAPRAAPPAPRARRTT